MRNLRRLLRARTGRRGQALVEFAIVLPVLLLILALAVDMGRIFLGWIAINNSVRVGANYAAMNATAWGPTPNTETQAKYLTLLTSDTSGLNCTRGSIPAPDFTGGTAIGQPVKVQLICTFQFMTPLVGNLFGGSLTMSAEAVFPVRTGIVVGGAAAAPPVINNVSSSPSASGSPPTLTGTAPLAVSFHADATNVQAWSWDFGDGSCPGAGDPCYSGPDTNHTYTAPGTYQVTVVGYNVTGAATDPYSVATVIVQPPPDDHAAFTWTPNLNGVAPFTITFSDASSPGPVSWSWDFGNGQTSTVKNPPGVSYPTVGTYTVTLSVTFPDGATKSAASQTVTILPGTKMCTVPNLVGKQTKQVEGAWTSAGFTTPVQYNPMPLNGYKVSNQYDGSAGGSMVPLPQGAKRACDTQVVIVTSSK